MANERATEVLTREILEECGYNEKNGFIIEQQSSDNKNISELLAHASKNNKRNTGNPDFIVRRKDLTEDNGVLIVIECKREIGKHSRKNRNDNYSPRTYAVDGVLHYGEFLRKKYNVLAVAISGTSKTEYKIDCNFMPKNSNEIKEIKEIDDKIIRYKKLYNYAYNLNNLKVMLTKTVFAEQLKDKIKEHGLYYYRDNNKDILNYLIMKYKATKCNSSLPELTKNNSYDLTLMVNSSDGEYGSLWFSLYESTLNLEEVFVKYSYSYKGDIVENIYRFKRPTQEVILFEEDRLRQQQEELERQKKIQRERLQSNVRKLIGKIKNYHTEDIVEIQYISNEEKSFISKDRNFCMISFNAISNFNIDDYSEIGLSKIRKSFLEDCKSYLKRCKEDIFKENENVNIEFNILDENKKEILQINLNSDKNISI